MKILAYFFGIAMLVSCQKTDSIKVIETHKNGNKRIVHTFFGDSERLLKTEEFYENGELGIEVIYDKSGKLPVEEVQYYSNGGILQEGNFKNGLRFNLWKGYFQTGELKSIANYNENGKEEGMYRVYRLENGIHYLFYEGYMKNGVRSGVWNFYNEKGIVINTETFKNNL